MYTYDIYFKNYFLYPCIAIALLLLLGLVLAAYLGVRRKSIWGCTITVIAQLLVIMLAIAIAFPALSHIEELPHEDENEQLIAVVEIKEIGKAFYLPTTNSFSPGILTTNQGTFLVQSTKGLREGGFIAIEYLPSSRCILDWQSTSEETFLVHRNIIEDSAEKEPEKAQKSEHEGDIITAMVIVFLVKTGLFSLFERKIFVHLEEQDSCEDVTKPRLLGVLYLVIDELAFVSGAVVSWLFGNTLLGMIHSVIAVVYGAWLVEVFSTKLYYKSEKVAFTSITTRMEFRLEDVCDVKWSTQLRVFGPVLKVRLNSGMTISLPKLYYLGLDNFMEDWEKHGNSMQS